MRKLGLGVLALFGIELAGCSDASTSAGGAGAGGGGDVGGAGGAAELTCEGTQTDDPLFAQAMERLRTELAVASAPGGAIAVIRVGSPISLGVVGTKSAGVCDPVTENTLFGSTILSEIITGIAALKAVEDGELELDASITDIIEVPVESGDVDAITLHHLLTYSSMYSSDADLNPLEAVCGSFADVFANAVNARIEATPGSMMDWNDRGNPELMGYLLETAYGQPFPEIVAQRVLAPLGMGGAYEVAAIEAVDHAFGQDQINFDCRNRDPIFGYYGSITDLGKLATYLLEDGGEVLGPAMHGKLLAPQAPSFFSEEYNAYAMGGWYNPEISNDMYVTSGYAFGLAASMLVFEQSGLAVVVMTNSASADTLGAAFDIATIYGVDGSAWADASYTPLPESLPSLLGEYADPIGVDGMTPRSATITEFNGNLVATITVEGSPPQMSEMQGLVCADNFGAEGIPVRFWRDDMGQGSAMQLAGNYGPPFFRVPE